MRLLHLDASPRSERSRSRGVAGAFIDALAGRHAKLAVRRLDLWDMALPELGGAMIEGRYNLIMGEAVPSAVADAWGEVRKIAEDFLDCDAYLVSTPMWNFGLPYRLKHYVDCVTQPGMAFSNDAQGNVVGLAAGRPAMLIGASALPIGVGGAMAELDYQLAYLEAWLRFVGVSEIATLRVAPTFGPPEVVDGMMATACAAARAEAARF
jgi:FMN-dependent NADH-azoreductase